MICFDFNLKLCILHSGMGKIQSEVKKHIPKGNIIATKTKCDILLTCGVSNWGGYAIAYGLAHLHGTLNIRGIHANYTP